VRGLKTIFILSPGTIGALGATKSAILMLMTASFASAVVGVLLSLLAGVPAIIAIPGFIVGVFFAIKYAMYERAKAREEEEEHKRTGRRHRH
jgi:uncharacterized membrane protein